MITHITVRIPRKSANTEPQRIENILLKLGWTPTGNTSRSSAARSPHAFKSVSSLSFSWNRQTDPVYPEKEDNINYSHSTV